MTYDDLIEQAYTGLKEIGGMSPSELKRWHASQPIVPPNVPVSQGFHLISEKGLSALQEIGRLWLKNNAAYSRVIGQAEAEEAAVAAFGDLIEAAGALPGTTTVKGAYLDLLEDRISKRRRAEHFYYAAHVFEQEDVGTFKIGPVTFFRKGDWLDHVERVSKALLSWKTEVLTSWSRSRSWWSRVRAMFAGFATRRSVPKSEADRIREFIGSCDWVISVLIEDQERKRATQCAAIVANVAMESLGLLYPREVSIKFRGVGHDTTVRKTERISQFEGVAGFNRHTAIDVPRIGGPPGQQLAILNDTHKLRNAVGDALFAFIDVAPKTGAPSLKQRWVEAMYWFGQARREQSEFIALVKYGITLDILAKGGKFGGILALCCAVLGKTEDDVITTDGRKLSKVVKSIYDDGRSQIAHGGRLSLLQPLPIQLSLADSLTSQVLIGYVAYTERYSGHDSYEQFLLAIPGIRAQLLTE